MAMKLTTHLHNSNKRTILMSFLRSLFSWFSSPKPKPQPLNEDDRQFLTQTVFFYRALGEEDQRQFERCCLLFLEVTEIIGHDVEIEREDELLVASSSVILAWGFEQWHYVNVDTVILVPGSFNERSEFGRLDSNIQGLVGNQHLSGKMILSKPALHAGFSNDRDKQNVALHEFSHLIDMADGEVDGFPKELKESSYALPWLALISEKTKQIIQGKSNIRAYGATNHAEFFAVSTEYFFERPVMMRNKHPKLYQALTDFYKQDRAEVKQVVKVRAKGPCPCGSGKRYKRCCMPEK